ncbi:head decoration protein [Vagococcus sp. WN89Y]|uniref:head decoration protein n=1 Tax=Vagococcus sp. WN89Y TaxID=3457258 RepID=UPI003FCCE052
MVDQIGQNPWSPGVKSAVFVPDQLVSGPLQLVTDTVTLTGGAVYRRGTVLGMITASGKYTISVKTAEDGSEKPVAILVDDVDTTRADQQGGIYLMGEFNQSRLIIDATWTLAELKTALRPLAIYLRGAVQAPAS